MAGFEREILIDVRPRSFASLKDDAHGVGRDVIDIRLRSFASLEDDAGEGAYSSTPDNQSN